MRSSAQLPTSHPPPEGCTDAPKEGSKITDKEGVRVSEAEIAAHWLEEANFQPGAEFIAQANMTDPGMFERFQLDKFPDCFKEYADLLSWDQYWHTTLDTNNAPHWRWFGGDRLQRQLQLRGPPPRPVADSGSRILITMDGDYRNGELLDHKIKSDEAAQVSEQGGQPVDKVSVWGRHAGQ